MAKIEWHENAKKLFRDYVENANSEFGMSTGRRWLKERLDIEWRLERYPVSYPPEELLQKEDALFRRCHLMNHRFKLIYFYDEVEDTVHIMDIWDTKANPKAMIKRIK